MSTEPDPSIAPAHGRSLVVASVFLLGFFAAVSQILLVREIVVVFFGSELCLGLILASWLAGVSVGAALGVRLSRRAGFAMRRYALCFLALLVLSALSVCMVRWGRAIMRVPVGELASFPAMVAWIAAVTIPLSAMVGLSFPLACIVTRREGKEASTEIGFVYVVEALGSICGGLLFTYVFAGRLGVFHSLWLPGLVCLACLAAACAVRRQPDLAWLCSLLALLLVMLVGTGAPAALGKITERQRWRAINPGLRMLCSVDSKYQNLVLTEPQDGQYSVFGSGQHMFSFPTERVSGGLAHMVLCEHPDPKRVLVIGGAMGGLLKHALMHDPENIDYVELDPAVHALVAAHLPPDQLAALADPRVTVHHMDGRRFVQGARGRRTYDVVLVNLPDPSSALLNRFYTVDFFREVRAVLARGGVLATGMTSAVNYLGDDVGSYSGTVYAALKRVFRHVVVTPGESKLFFACDIPGVITTSMDRLGDRYDARDIRTDLFSRYHFGQYLETPERVAFVREAFEALRESPPNTDLHPVSYFYSLVLWDRFSGGALAPVLKAVAGVRVRWVAAAVALAVMLRVLYAGGRRIDATRRGRFNALAAIATTGFAAMALETALLYAYQSYCGFVYRKIGLVFAMFMVGLSTGGILASRAVATRRWRWNWCLAGTELGVVFFSLCVPVVLGWLSTGAQRWAAEWVIPLLVLGAGCLTGWEFPVANRVYLEGREGFGRAAALTDSLDHLGGFAGALLTGVLLVPVLGLVVTCFVVALLNAGTAALALAGLTSRE